MNEISRELHLPWSVLVVLASLLAAGCNDAGDPTAPQTQATGNVQPVAAPVSTQRPAPKRGRVLAAQTVGGYTFIEIDSGTDRIWLATTPTAVKPGETIEWKKAALMRNFTSKSMGRSFDRILFVERISRPGAATAGNHRGMVAEHMDAAGYSFIRVEAGGVSTWLAAPRIQLEIGQHIEWSGGSTMRNFNSPSLQRSFDEIVFVGSVHPS